MSVELFMSRFNEINKRQSCNNMKNTRLTKHLYFDLERSLLKIHRFSLQA
jgi:hypothetical protein